MSPESANSFHLSATPEEAERCFGPEGGELATTVHATATHEVVFLSYEVGATGNSGEEAPFYLDAPYPETLAESLSSAVARRDVTPSLAVLVANAILELRALDPDVPTAQVDSIVDNAHQLLSRVVHLQYREDETQATGEAEAYEPEPYTPLTPQEIAAIHSRHRLAAETTLRMAELRRAPREEQLLLLSYLGRPPVRRRRLIHSLWKICYNTFNAGVTRSRNHSPWTGRTTA